MAAVLNKSAKAERDSSGNLIGLRLAGLLYRLRPKAGLLRWAIAGDSITEPYSYAVGNSASIVSPGVARVGFPFALSGGTFWPGDEIKVTTAQLRQCNQQSAIVSAVDPGRTWIEYSVSADRENGVIGSLPFVSRKYALNSGSYIAHACAQLGIPFQCAVDASMAGGDCEQVLEVLQRDWADSDVAVYAPGMNCVYSRGWDLARIKAADSASLKILRQAPILLVLSIPARLSTAGGWTADRYAVWRQVNEWRRQEAERIGAIFIDLSAASLRDKTYCNPLSDNNDPYGSGLLQTMIDGVHPADLGALIVGSAIAEPLKGHVLSDLLPASVANVNAADGYINPNPLMRVGAAGASPGVPGGTATFQNLAGASTPEIADNYVVSVDAAAPALVLKAGVVTRSNAVHGDRAGNAQRVIIDNTGNASAVTVRIRSQSFHAAMRDGDVVDYGMHVLLSDMATPGTGDPAGVTSMGVYFGDQHATATGKSGAALSGGGASTGRYPGGAFAAMFTDKTRSVAGAGAFTSTLIGCAVIVAANSSACVDVGRVLTRRRIKL